MIIQTLEELENDLRTYGLRKVYAILGQESYHVRSALKLLKNRAFSPESISLDYTEIRGAGATAAQIMQSAGILPMVAKCRVTLVTESEKLTEDEQELLVHFLQNHEISSRSVLIFLAEELDHRRKFYKTLLEIGCVAEFRKLKGPALERWAEAFIRRKGYRISTQSLKRVVDLAGEDLQSLSQELEKLLLFAGKEKNIPDSAIDSIIIGNRQHSIFELLDAVDRRDHKGALRLLGNLLQTGESPLTVVAMMARHCRQVLIANECIQKGKDLQEVAKAAQISPYFLEKLLQQARTADISVIQQILIQLAEIDRRLKSTAGDGHTMLDKLICSLV